MSLLIDPDALAAAVILAEAGNQAHPVRVGVGEAIRNRMRTGFYSDGTVAGTVLARYQFSEFNDDKADVALLIRVFNTARENPAAADCIAAWEESATSSVAPGAVQFYAAVGDLVTTPPKWVPEFVFITQLGDVRFYRRK